MDSVGFGPPWSTQQVPSQPELHGKEVSNKDLMFLVILMGAQEGPV